MSRSVKKRWASGGLVVGICVSVALAVTLGAGAVTASIAAAPVNTSPPTVTGTPQEGKKLTGKDGTWTGNPTDINVYWVRCDKTGASCAKISGSESKTYTLTSVDVGDTLRFRADAKNADGTTSASSVPTAVVTAATAPPPPVTNGCAKTGGTVPVAGISSPARLSIDQTQVSPSAINFGTRSLTVRFHVGACKGSVEGALVYVTAVPYGQFAIPNEQATGSDGWATLQFNAQAGYPVSSKQQLIVMFVRARKSGEDILGGISTRRLVSFRVSQGL